MSAQSLQLQRLLDDAVASGIFPAAQAVVLQKGRERLSLTAGGATPQTLFDLASLTKVLSTTSLFTLGWGRGMFGPETKLARLVPDAVSARAGVTLRDLLTHRSGLPSFVPYFARAMPAVPELFLPDCPPSVREEVRVEVVRAAFATGLSRPVAAEAVYSDVGFIQLGEALAQAFGRPLDALFSELVQRPLELGAHFRRLSVPAPAHDTAPTGTTRPREPTPGQESLWTPFPVHPGRPAEVDDDNAWVMDGVAGHAGLFGTAEDVARFGQAVLEELQGAGRVAPAPLWELLLRKDVQTPGSTRALGFDTPSDENPSTGRFLGRRPPGAVGHLGFTGVSLWIDRARALSVALLTNRTAHGRGDVRIKAFRPRFHDAVVQTLEESPS